MTIEELTFTAFLAGRERGREESAAEVERLRALVKDAYGEGYSDATTETMYLDDNWKQSATYAALQPKEGE